MTLAAAIGVAVHRDNHPLGLVAGGNPATVPATIDHRRARPRSWKGSPRGAAPRTSTRTPRGRAPKRGTGHPGILARTACCDLRLPWLRRLDRAIDIGLEFHEILAEHFNKLFRGRLKSLFVRPGFNRIEEIRVDAVDGKRHGDPKMRIVAEAYFGELGGYSAQQRWRAVGPFLRIECRQPHSGEFP
jgi:hypothetical protein